MYNNKKILAIIPARGGSKRLPGKNIKELAGKPLIAWTIEAALQSEIFDTIMVSTDDSEIARLSKLYGADVPFIRDSELSTDTSSSIDVVLDTLRFYENKNENFNIVILLQPTSPLRESNDIIGALQLFEDNKAESVISVCEVDHPVQWCNELSNSLSMDSFFKEEYKNKRSQDFSKSYRLNGAIYIWDKEHFISEKNVIIPKSFAYVMDKNSSVDIDEEIDFIIAEALLKSKS